MKNVRKEKSASISVEDHLLKKYTKLQQYCYFLTRNEWDGNDLAQETVAKVLRHYKQPSVISTSLLQKIAYHQWIDTIRKRKKEAVYETNEDQSLGLQNMEDALIISEYLLKNLTPKQAVTFLLKEAFQYKTQEIAEMLGMTEGSVKSTIQRMKKRLEKADPEQGSTFVDCFWHEEEKQEMKKLIQISLRTQDPTHLIQAIPFFRSLRSDAQLLLKSKSSGSLPAHTPYCIIQSAA